MEVFIACGLLAVVVAVTVEMLSMTATAGEPAIAAKWPCRKPPTPSNSRAAIPFAELSDERLAQIKLSPAVAALLPGEIETGLRAGRQVGRRVGRQCTARAPRHGRS